jgi:retron-type reverse transcriptase
MAITFDIKSFFDNLNHKLIKDSWKRLLNYEELPDDHYNVFRNITKFSYVDIYDLFDEFKNELIARKNGNACKVAVQKLKFMRDKDIIAFCNTKDFNNRIRSKGLIKSNKKIKNEVGLLEFRNKGVPQGSPISSFLANLYLLEFDTVINHEIMSKGGMYRRYSDDIVIICNYEDGIYFRDMILANIKEFDLEIQIKKTNSFVFYNKS